MRRSTLIVLLLSVSVAGCDQGALDPPEQAGLVEPTVAAGIAGEPDLNRDLAAAKRATAQFHRIATAVAAGFVPVTPCLEQLPDGAQGVHFGNPARIDGIVEAESPEILQYEPQKNGRMRLVGIEYIVPLNLPEPDPLFGQHFHANAAAGIWALHVWAWRHNPSGMFADWNPNVSCDHAD